MMNRCEGDLGDLLKCLDDPNVNVEADNDIAGFVQ